ncbi:4391_t:CDS:2 [Acaulospora colombiana]|uniref:4391_t:CDS:1 n=1 Tax=Acaulospora colombiana TaxID=27376 RepID=A0ACA9M7C4_9GLOM|nr:4391_t:CDS:2 [Acaulospora colombiana]
MSVYNAYAATSHGPSAPFFSQQTRQPQPYQQPYQGYYAPTPQPPPMDENEFRSFYAQRLGTLTVNSRPIIQDLSMLAQSYPHMAHVVVDAIERQMAPPFKLPLFYLLDSIAKNAFEPYAAAFSSRIVRLFLDTYYAVDQQTQHKMREMMATWRSGSPNHRELFGSAVQSEIERVWGTSVRRLLPLTLPRPLKPSVLSGQRVPSASQVMTELDVVLVQKERAAQQNPYDELLPRHINALQELKKMVPTMNTGDLTATLTRLREMARASVGTVQHIPVQPAPPVSYGPTGYPTMSQPPFGYPPAPAVLPTSIVPSPAKQSVSAPVAIEISATTSLEDYEKAILRCKLKITSNDIARTPPQVLPFLYIKNSPQCNECGMRFPAGEDGKVKLRDHLDQHFRQNTRATENNWVADIPEHPLNKTKRSFAKMTDKQRAEAVETLRKELEAKFLVVPPGEEGKEIRCGICMEVIKVEFQEDDDEGDWVWKNAVKVDNKVGSTLKALNHQNPNMPKIYHATCHHDWANSSFNKQRLAEMNSSRQGTPEVHSRGTGSQDGTPLRIKSDSPKTPPRLLAVAGTKRKAAISSDPNRPALLSSKEGTPLSQTEDDEPRLKRRVVQT